MKVLKLVSLGIAILVSTYGCCRTADDGPWMKKPKLVDLTQEIHEEIPFFPGGIGPSFEPLRTIKADGYNLMKITMSTHTGTHVDFPYHFLEKGKRSQHFPLEELCFPAYVIDISSKADDNPDYALSVSDVEQFERDHGQIKPDSFVIVRTGWSKYWGTPSKYLNVDKKGVMHFPGVSKEAAELLIKGRKVSGIGIDTLSIDPGTSKTFDAHKVILGYEKIVVENLKVPNSLPAKIRTLCVWPLKILNASGAPARVGAWIYTERLERP